MRKQIFIHIGIGKTGTSSIQHVLSEHRADLERQSFLYPTTGQRWEEHGCGHFDLPALDVPGIQGELSGLYDRLDAELAECAASKIILSSEILSFAQDGFIRDLANRLKEHDVRAIFYAREQCSLIESAFLWWQKIGNDYLGEIRSFYDVQQDSFDLLARVSPWARAFGHDRIMCRLYDRQLMGGNDVNDIVQALGIRLDAGSLVAAENPSIPACFSRLVTLLDCGHPSPEDRAEAIQCMLDAATAIPSNRRGKLIDPAFAEEITSRYFNSNQHFTEALLDEPARTVFLTSVTPESH